MLDKIVAHNKAELIKRKEKTPLSLLKERIAEQGRPRDFAAALKNEELSIIAEIKQASPSRGLLANELDPAGLAKRYQQGGASAISVLTEAKFFKGSLSHLEEVRGAVSVPVLRKDFIFDPYQVYESRAYGADALLLIVAILGQKELEELLRLARELGMECLVETHNESEVETAVASGAAVIGVNNRDLQTFRIDIDTTHRLLPLIPKDRTRVSESGINNREDMKKLKRWGVDAVLVGEALMTACNTAAKMRELKL